jgi:hypothetical protein
VNITHSFLVRLKMAQRTGLEPRDASLLAPSDYDDDASSLHDDDESGSEEDESYNQIRTSEEIREHDRSILLEEDEREEMLREKVQEDRSSRLAAPLKHLFGKAYNALPKKQ